MQLFSTSSKNLVFWQLVLYCFDLFNKIFHLGYRFWSMRYFATLASLRHNSRPKRHFATRAQSLLFSRKCITSPKKRHFDKKNRQFVEKASLCQIIVTFLNKFQLNWMFIIRTVTIFDDVTLFFGQVTHSRELKRGCPCCQVTRALFKTALDRICIVTEKNDLNRENFFFIKK